MTHAYEEQLKRAFDSLAERMRTIAAEHATETVQQLLAHAATERDAAVEAASRQAAEQAEQRTRQELEEAFAQREGAIRETAGAEAFEAGLRQARAEALAIEQAREAAAQVEAQEAEQLMARHEEELAAVRAEASARIDAALTAARVDAAAVASEHDGLVSALRAELEAAQVASVEAAARHADELAQALAGADAAAMDHTAALAVAHAAAAKATAAAEAAHASAQAAAWRIERAGVERLLAAVRALDGATSLSQTLDALAAAATGEAERSVVFLVRGEVLRTWSHSGFDALPQNAPLDLPMAEGAVVADAARTASPQRTTDAAGRPAFAGEASGGALVAVPLSMNGQVVAVVCGEQQSASDGGDWLATHYEVLARHAARVLESLTALRLAQLGAHPTQAAASPPQ